MKKALLTSFTTWEAHQASNSSDDLLEILVERELLSDRIVLARKLPVDFTLAPQVAIAAIKKFSPDLVICCGMAESRQVLTVEQYAWRADAALKTKVNLKKLVKDLSVTQISKDAGRYVCNSLYFDLLDYLHRQNLEVDCVFVHVPILTEGNREAIATNFLKILQRLQNPNQ
jgi:pyroglutamyl-peptidase